MKKAVKQDLFRLYKQLPGLKQLQPAQTFVDKDEKFLLVQVRVNLFSHLGLKSLLGR